MLLSVPAADGSSTAARKSPRASGAAAASVAAASKKINSRIPGVTLRRRISHLAPTLVKAMIEQLVEQIEARFAALAAQMSDPEVIGDRQRYAEVGRAYSELEPAAELA